jgi:hypothetical protein
VTRIWYALREVTSPSLQAFAWRKFLWAEFGAPVHEVWVESPLDSEWVAAFRLFEQEGQIVIGELRIHPAEEKHAKPGRWSAETERLGISAQVPEGGLTARKLRQVRFDATRDFIREALAEVRKRQRREKDPAFAKATAEMLASFGGVYDVETVKRRPKSGRRPWPDEEYAGLAARYVGKVQSGSARPIAELAKELHYSPARIRQALLTARRRGLLTDTRRGRAGGELTGKALAILRSGGEA